MSKHDKDHRKPQTRERDLRAAKQDQCELARKLPDVNIDGSSEAITGGRNSGATSQESRRTETR